MKYCAGCEQNLKLNCFSKNGRSKDELEWRCRACKHEQAKKYYLTDAARAKNRARWKKSWPKLREKRLIAKRIYNATHKVEQRARHLARRAIRYKFMPHPASQNGKRWDYTLEFHHPDHSRPYYGVWMKITDHRRVDIGSLPCPPCHDYAAQVLEGVLKMWGFGRAVAIAALRAVEGGENA